MITCRAKEKKFVKLNIGESIFIIFFIPFAVYILIGSPFFEIKRIHVEGNNFYSSEKILLDSGIEPGVNIFKVNLANAAKKLNTLSMLKDVHITRVLPSQILITVTERKPLALLPAAGRFIIVDAEGVCCREGKIGETGLPLITGININIPPVGQAVNDPELAVALNVIKSLPQDLTQDLSEVYFDKNKGVILYTLEGVQCRLGLPDKIDSKGTVLAQVLDKQKNKRIDYIDLSIESYPVVRYKEEG